MPTTLLSDFDGVWTDQALEAEHVKIHLIAEAARLAERSADIAHADFARFETAVRARPDAYGWAPDGRITAYLDEDPFCVPNSLTTFVDTADDDAARAYREAVLGNGFADLSAFADRCFLDGMRSFRDQHPPGLVPHAAAVIDALHAAGVTVVVVSNSPTEKIVEWFSRAGVDAGGDAGHAVRVRGQAGKQTLGQQGECIDAGGRRVCVDRPLYARVIEEENPDVVIGDVFSLDLALPHVLRTRGAACAPHTTVLRRHPHTPAWVLQLQTQGMIDHVVDDVGALMEICT